MEDPRGSVSSGDCENLARNLDDFLNDLYPGGFSLTISSAGAERELRLPGDLERFQGQTARLVFEGEGGIESGVYTLGKITEGFITLLPEQKEGKKIKKNANKPAFTVNVNNIVKGNLTVVF